MNYNFIVIYNIIKFNFLENSLLPFPIKLSLHRFGDILSPNITFSDQTYISDDMVYYQFHLLPFFLNNNSYMYNSYFETNFKIFTFQPFSFPNATFGHQQNMSKISLFYISTNSFFFLSHSILSFIFSLSDSTSSIFNPIILQLLQIGSSAYLNFESVVF